VDLPATNAEWLPAIEGRVLDAIESRMLALPELLDEPLAPAPSRQRRARLARLAVDVERRPWLVNSGVVV